MAQYVFPILASRGYTDGFNEYKLESFHWESASPYRPDVFFSLFAVENDGIYCRIRAYEAAPRTVCKKRDEPVYEDSALEFFIAPVPGRNEYINVECNSNGVFLSQFGAARDGRVFIREITGESPEVVPLSGNDASGIWWGVEIHLPQSLIAALFNTGFTAAPQTFRFNVFKCGDCTETPHYLAFSPVGEMPPGFHNPDCFADAVFKR